MDDDETVIFFIGLIIVGFCIGIMTEAVYGWFTFGAGMVLAAIVSGAFRYLNGNKE